MMTELATLDALALFKVKLRRMTAHICARCGKRPGRPKYCRSCERSLRRQENRDWDRMHPADPEHGFRRM